MLLHGPGISSSSETGEFGMLSTCIILFRLGNLYCCKDLLGYFLVQSVDSCQSFPSWESVSGLYITH